MPLSHSRVLCVLRKETLSMCHGPWKGCSVWEEMQANVESDPLSFWARSKGRKLRWSLGIKKNWRIEWTGNTQGTSCSTGAVCVIFCHSLVPCCVIPSSCRSQPLIADLNTSEVWSPITTEESTRLSPFLNKASRMFGWMTLHRRVQCELDGETAQRATGCYGQTKIVRDFKD